MTARTVTREHCHQRGEQMVLMVPRLRHAANAKYDELILPASEVKSYKSGDSESDIIDRQHKLRHAAKIPVTHRISVLRGLQPPIYWLGRQWAVTDKGIEQLKCDGYKIDRFSLADPYWLEQMVRKEWVDAKDFKTALSFARDLFNITVHHHQPELDADK